MKSTRKVNIFTNPKPPGGTVVECALQHPLPPEGAFLFIAMATAQRVKKLENDVRRLHGLREMKACLLRETPTPENRELFYAADDRLDEKLDEYFAASLMYFHVEKPELYNLYIDAPKEEVKAKLLRQITKQKNEYLAYELAVSRIGELEIEEKTLKKTPQKRPRLKYVQKTLARLRSWSKDLNYEKRQGKTRFKTER